MITPQGSTARKLQCPDRPGGSVARLLVVMVMALAVVTPFAVWIGHIDGLVAAGIAWIACTIAGTAGLGVSLHLAGRGDSLGGLLWGIVLRMFLPLSVCVWAYAQGGTLADSGIAFYLLVFYLVDLASVMLFSAWALRGAGFGKKEA